MAIELNESEYRDIIQELQAEPINTLHFAPNVAMLLANPDHPVLRQKPGSESRNWERYSATPSLHTQLPSHSGIYMFVWAPGPTFHFGAAGGVHESKWVLYVGKAGVDGGTKDTLRDRYRTYRQWIAGDPRQLWSVSDGTSRRNDRLARFLTLRPLEYWCLELSDVRQIVPLEKWLIRILNPPLNSQHTLRARLGRERPAW